MKYKLYNVCMFDSYNALILTNQTKNHNDTAKVWTFIVESRKFPTKKSFAISQVYCSMQKSAEKT